MAGVLKSGGILLTCHLLFAGASLLAADETLLYDGKLNPACVWTCSFTNKVMRPIEVVTDFGGERVVDGVTITAPRSWVNCCVKKASFYGVHDVEKLRCCEVERSSNRPITSSTSQPHNVSTSQPLAEHVSFRPGNTYSKMTATWKPVTCRGVKMVIEETWDGVGGYYDWVQIPDLENGNYEKSLGGMKHDVWSGKKRTVQIAELRYLEAAERHGVEKPSPELIFETRLIRDWQYQECAPKGNPSLVANTTADTTVPDRIGRDVSMLPPPDAAWLARRRAMRRDFLKSFRREFTQFVYVTHNVMGNSIMHATDDLSDAPFLEWRTIPEYLQTPSRLVLATIAEDGSVTEETLLEEPQGVIRDPNLSFDAQRLVFSKRSSLTHDDYHLFTMDLATREVRQITFDGSIDLAEVRGVSSQRFPCSDIEPCFLPDGSILFQSTRCGHNVDCWPLPVSNLYRCEADGSRLRRVGFDQVQTFFPQVMDDGRISFTRWEYNDRQTGYLQKLCSMLPDGTGVSGLFGNNSEFPVSLLHARAVPGTEFLLATSAGHHTGQKGKLVELNLARRGEYDYRSSTYDPAQAVHGISTNGYWYDFPGNRRLEMKPTPWDAVSGSKVAAYAGVRYVAGGSPDGAAGTVPVAAPKFYSQLLFDGHAQIGPQWAYPFPVAADEGTSGNGQLFLVSFLPEGSRFQRGPFAARMGIYAMDGGGRRELLAYDRHAQAMQAIPVKARKVPGRTNRPCDYGEGFGVFYIQDIYDGAAMAGAPTGCAKRLRVVAMELRPTHIGWNWQYGCHSHTGKIGTPISVGNGSYDVKHVFGEAEIEADGSCCFKAPARTPVYFQVVDGKGCVVQTMRSWTTLQPGEKASCIGCHEDPDQAPRTARPLALQRAPQRLKPWGGGEEHPLLAKLENEGPLASLDNFMGVNRPKPVDGSDVGEGFSFRRQIQPILNRRCLACHAGVAGRPDFRDERPSGLPESDLASRRKFTRAYLALSCNGACCDNVNFAHAQGFAPFRGPYAFGSARSKWFAMLEKGHLDGKGCRRVELSVAELRTIALWIDLCVPFCGTYVEGHDWTPWHVQRYVYAQNKRLAFAWMELNDIRRERGLAPVPLKNFVPNVTEPKKQVNWYD